jgi:hypothetical protein
LLSKPYPETFYAEFNPENFAMCFTCHDKKLVEAKEAEGLTGFRNGKQNLHFAHVNKEKGRTCRACHEKHASPRIMLAGLSQGVHVRPQGARRLRRGIGNGRLSGEGCQAMKRRVFSMCQLVIAVITLATSRQLDAADPAKWTASDITSTSHTVPADKPSLLLFLRPGQPQSDEQVKTLTAALKSRKDLQVLAIVSGDDAATAAGRLAKEKCPWPIVADRDYAASGNFTVRVWPSTVIISTSGEKVAHISGLPVSLENDVSAYLDFAAKKIDKAALDKRLADRQVVGDSPDEKAMRHIQVAERLAAKSLTDEARRELSAALALKPKSPGVLLHVARTQLALGDAPAAEKLLNSLGGENLPPTAVSVLKGWCALEQNRWDDARKILTDCVKLNPDPAENYYLLGRVHEHDNQPAKAAEAYRKAFEHTPLGKSMIHR